LEEVALWGYPRYEMEARQSFEKARSIEASTSEAQRRAASDGVRSKTVSKGMRNDAEEGVKGCKKWRKMLQKP